MVRYDTHIHFVIVKELGVDLFANDRRSDVVLFGEAEPHLLQYKLYFLSLLHRAKRLYLQQEKQTRTHRQRHRHLMIGFYEEVIPARNR